MRVKTIRMTELLIILSDKCLCRLIVDDHTVKLSGYQCLNRIRTLVVTMYGSQTCILQIPGSVQIAGGCLLNTDVVVSALCEQIICAGDLGTFGNDDYLNTCSIRIQ